MDVPARKEESIDEEFQQLLKRWGDKDLESLHDEAGFGQLIGRLESTG